VTRAQLNIDDKNFAVFFTTGISVLVIWEKRPLPKRNVEIFESVFNDKYLQSHLLGIRLDLSGNTA
jgi:hypothetical protein